MIRCQKGYFRQGHIRPARALSAQVVAEYPGSFHRLLQAVVHDRGGCQSPQEHVESERADL